MNPVLAALDDTPLDPYTIDGIPIAAYTHLYIRTDRPNADVLIAGEYIGVVGTDDHARIGRLAWHGHCEGGRILVMWLHEGNFTELFAVVVATGCEDHGRRWVLFRNHPHVTDLS
jgi:hypothetical protein